MTTKNETPIPSRMMALPQDPDRPRFRVPWFVHREDGRPDYRIIGEGKIVDAVRKGRCWLCGGFLGGLKAFVVGPMCTLNRISSEPPSHVECAEYAVQVCPFLTKPAMKRNVSNLPDDTKPIAGNHNPGNPGVMVVWVTRSYLPVRVRQSDHLNAGVLFEMGVPYRVTWWTEGRRATREEADQALSAGAENLRLVAREEGPAALDDVMRLYDRALSVLPIGAGEGIPEPL